MYASLYGCLWVRAVPVEAGRGCQMPLEMEFQAAVSLPTWVLGTGRRSFAREVQAFDPWTDFPAFVLFLIGVLGRMS